MTKPLLWATLALGAALVAAPALAVDHDNVDAGRPLSFDDADPIAYQERALEFGFSLNAPRGAGRGAGGELEYLYGFALNSHYVIGFDPTVGGRAGSDDTRFDVGDLAVGAFYNFNRETLTSPALAVRGDAYLPTGRDSRGVGFRLRGILTKTARQYDRFHLNVDANFRTSAGDEERKFRSGVTLGYSVPVGYPTRFNQTALAEVSWQQSEEKGKGGVVSMGAGLRRQVTVRSVLDVGVQSDVAASGGAPRDHVRLIAGYSTAF